MRTIRTSILPSKQTFVKINASRELNLEAICIFAATGFFLDDDTYWKDERCLLPGYDHIIDEKGKLSSSTPWFEWYYEPRSITFEEALEEYIDLLTSVIKDQVGDSEVILPLSGGLDSRSQALIFKNLDNPVHAYSYSFLNGYPEHKISAKIAKNCGFKFTPYIIPKSYLWNCIDDLAHINKCYSEFTHPRQMAILDEFKAMNGIFSLGHWGDVFFDRGVKEGARQEDVVKLLIKKMIKPGGMELGNMLWQNWGLEGDFKSYFIGRVEQALSTIKIDNVSARVRAFKTTQWAHRWTTTNLSIFESARPISMPFYDDRICKFICTIPEEYLADRRLQIAHLKQDRSLSQITWHQQKPFNLNNYHLNKVPYNLPYRTLNKLKREFNGWIGKPYIQRNFELQFLGNDNLDQLNTHLYSGNFLDLVPKSVVDTIYNKFKSVNNVMYSHPTSMLLTLSLWSKHFNRD